MKPKPLSGPAPELDQPPPAPMEAPRPRRADTRDTLHALAKDVQSVTAHAQVLHEQARHAIDAARATRARAAVSNRPQDMRLTVPEACRLVGVCERTLRVALREPGLAARLQEGTRKVGTFYKAVQLLPPALVDDLQLRYAQKKNGNQSRQ